MCTLGCSMLVSWCATTLCFVILKPFGNVLLHRESRCSEESLLLLFAECAARVGVCAREYNTCVVVAHVLG